MTDAVFWMGLACFLCGVFAGGMMVTSGVARSCEKGALTANGKAYIVREAAAKELEQ